MTLLQWLLLATLSVLWGGSFFFVELLLETLPPLTIVTLRVAIAAMVLWPVVITRGLPLPNNAAAWGALAIMALLNNVLPFSLIVWGQTGISGGLASILNATTPVFTVVVAAVFLADERITVGKALGVLLGVVGVIVMIGFDALLEMRSSVLSQLAVLAASLSYAFAATYGRLYLGNGMPALVIAAGQVSMSALLLAPAALIIESPLSLPAPSANTWAVLLALAVLSTAAAYQLYFWLLARAGATNTSLVTVLVPVSAVVLGWLFLDETLTAKHIVGMSIIGAGLVALDGRLFRRRRADTAD
ncbi:MAG: DMT family transporter [Pseudomonadota bacterium]